MAANALLRPCLRTDLVELGNGDRLGGSGFMGCGWVRNAIAFQPWGAIMLFCLSLQSPFSLVSGVDLRSPWDVEFIDANGLGLLRHAIASV
jgi:hypothetical protein